MSFNTKSKEKEDLSSNPTEERMLFLFHPDKIDTDSYCGCTMRTGIKISSAILLFIGISNFYTVIKEETYYEDPETYEESEQDTIYDEDSDSEEDDYSEESDA